MSARRVRWRAVAAATALAAVTALTGCGPALGDLPLPGSGVSGDTIEVEVEFDEVLNLAEGAVVKVNGVDAGRVRSVRTKDFKAIAVLELRRSAQMRETATARLRYTTPLGELFVEVTNPPEGPVLGDGAALTTASSSTAPTVEDALAGASLFINGGGLTQLQTVTDELNAVLGGREDTVRTLLDRADHVLGEANGSRADIDRALRALARLSKVLADNRATVADALRDLRPAARVLRQNTPDFARLLARLAEFSETADGVVGATRDDILQMVRQVSPVLDEFLANRDDLGPSLRALVELSDDINTAIPGDYANMRLTAHVDKMTLPDVLGTKGPGGQAANPVGDLLSTLTGQPKPRSGATASSAPVLPGLLEAVGGLLGGGLLGGGR